MTEKAPLAYSYDAETALLSILLKAPELVFQLNVLKPTMFSSTPYIALYSVMQELQEQKLVADQSLILNYLTAKGKINIVGGEQTLQYLSSLSYNPANLKEFERQIVSAYKTRELISLASGIARSQLDATEIDNIIVSLQNSLNTLSNSSGGEATESLSSIIEAAYRNLIHRLENPGLAGITTGISDIDSITGGIEHGDLWVLASRPSMGKSALMCNSILQMAKQNIPVLVFSLEMNKQHLMERLISIETGIALLDIRMAQLTQAQLNLIASKIKEIKLLPIYFDCNYSMNLNYVLTTTRKYKKLYDIQAVYVDYIQLLAERDDNQTAELGRISRSFKLIAGDLNIGMIAISQINRSVEARDNKRPILSDLRQSGNIEEDADIVSFLYRDEYYNPKTKSQGELEYIIRKNRSGPIGTVYLNFEANTNRIIKKP